MPKNTSSNETQSEIHRSSPYEKPAETIEGSLHTLEGVEIDDSELLDLMSRLGELNRSEQRRLMVLYRKRIEKYKKNSGESKASTIQNIGERFPGIQTLIKTSSNENKKNKKNGKNKEAPVIITTRKINKQNEKNVPTKYIRRSSRLNGTNLKLNSNSNPTYNTEIVYEGNKKTKKQLIKDIPFQCNSSEGDQEYDSIDQVFSRNYNPMRYDNSGDLPGFVVDDDDDDEDEELGEELGSVDSYTDTDTESLEIGIDEELNDLNSYVPVSSSRKRMHEINEMRGEERLKFHTTLQEIQNNYNEQKIDIAKVIKSDFNAEDNGWFYSRLARINKMEGKERYDLEDQIQRKFATLISLKTSGLYEKFNKPAERNIIKEILDSDKPDEIKKIMISRMISVPQDGSEEYQKAMSWLDVVMSIPTTCKNVISSGSDKSGSNKSGSDKSESDKDDIKTEFGSLLFRLKKNLDSNLFGMENVKRQIMQAVTTIYNNPDSRGYVIALVGDPGVGKTTISSQIAEAIGMGFGQISCGTVSSMSVVVGHSSTYIGSYPGIFTQLLMRTGQLNNVVLLDELDKLPDKTLLPTLLQILDRESNFRFKDAFCPEIDIDMSKNLYIIAVNDTDCFNKALRDRMKIIYVDGYDVDQKTQICYNYVIPKIQARTGIISKIDKTTIKYFINKVSPNISGVRDITHFFEDIYEKLQLIQKLDFQTWSTALDTSEFERPSKRARVVKVVKRGKTQNDKKSEEPNAVKFREVVKNQLNLNIPEGVDLRNINAIEYLSIELIKSLE